MRTTFFSLAGLGLLLATALAAPTTSNSMPPLQITKTKIHQVHNGNTTINFTVYDPSPLTNATQECSATWKTGSAGYPSGPYQPCGNSSFAWNMDTFTSISSFVLAIEHVYEDDAIGAYPYNSIGTFAKGNVSKPNITCTAMGGQQSCEQKSNVVIMAPIWAVSAKR